MSESVELEKAFESDLASFVHMESQLDTRQFIVPYSFSDHQTCLSDPSIIYLRILTSKKLAGFFILALDAGGRSVEFRRIVVAQDARGIGQTAIRLMERYCTQELKRQRLWLDVYTANARARHIYEKLGYRRFEPKNVEEGSLLYYEKVL